MKYISKNIKQTEKLAKCLVKKIKKGSFIAIYGDLGAGKTVFCKAIIKKLVGAKAFSPTFTILNEYVGKTNVYHFDMYRLDNPKEIENIGYENYFYGDGICLVEWPEKIDEYLPKERINIYINKVDDNTREFVVEGLN